MVVTLTDAPSMTMAHSTTNFPAQAATWWRMATSKNEIGLPREMNFEGLQKCRG